MRTAIYTIALNEEQFVHRWYESAREADYLLIADTGSKDQTTRIAQQLGIDVVPISVKPWRFDDARNAALAILPEDVDFCIALDMDEVLLPGWRSALEKALAEGWSRPRYKYTWSWNADGSPGLQYGGDKIHTRKNYRWKHPVHEVLSVYGSAETQGWVDLEIHHYPDATKPRSQYLPLLKMSVEEDPYDDRNAFYYARELFFYRKYEEAAKEFERHLSLKKAVWKPERAASKRYLAKCRPQEAEKWLLSAVEEDPTRREARVELAQYYYSKKDWVKVLEQTSYCIDNLVEKPLDYLCEDFAWGALPYDLGALAAHYSQNPSLAQKWGAIAVELDPTNERLRTNQDFYQAALPTNYQE